MKPGLPAPDFLRPVARPGRLAWAWCVTALLVLAISLAEGHATWQQRQQALDRLARAGQTAPTAATATARAGTPVASRGGTTIARGPAPARQAEAAAWQTQLALPWPTVWAASEAAADLGYHVCHGHLRTLTPTRSTMTSASTAPCLPG